MINRELYKLYKPLRNHLRLCSIENALAVIWAYVNLLQFNRNLPKDIQVADELIKNKDSIQRGLYEWELALLAREVMVNGQKNLRSATKYFQSWDFFSAAINKLKNFENKAWPIFGNVGNVKYEISRVARRQFSWHIKPSSAIFVRYFKIYNNPRVSNIVERRIGLSIRKWYALGTVILGAMLDYPKFNIDPKIEVSGINRDDFDKFLRFVSIDLDGIISIIQRDIKYDDQYVYSFNPLEYYPLIKMGSYYYCPISTYIVSRVTSGIYFDLVNDPKFGHPFGLAFQDYLLEISNKVINSQTVKVLPEEKYHILKTEKDSVDIILFDGESALFVEAKTKRLSVRSRSEFLTQDSILKDMEVLAEAIVQIYSTILDYEKGFYSHFKYNPGVRIYPVIVTLEDWFIFGEEIVTLKNIVKEKMAQENIDLTYLERMPYIVTWSLVYESLIQLLNKYSIYSILSDWFTPDKSDHNFGQYITQKFGKECKFIDDYFPEDFEKIYPQLFNK